MAGFVWLLLGMAVGFALGALISLFRRHRSIQSHVEERVTELCAARDYAEALIENMPDGFIVVDENWAIVRVNNSYCRMTGRSREELIGLRPPYPGWAPEEREMMARRLSRATRGEDESFELTYIRPDGERMPLRFNPGKIRTPNGENFYFAIVQDLTQLKKNEEKLKESLETFRRIAETSTDTIYQLDLGGMVTYCSPSVERVLGYRQEDFIGTHFRNHFLPQDLPPAQEAFIRNISGEEIRNVELRIRDKNGKPVSIEVNATPIRKGDQIIGSQGIARDISARKRVEDSLRVSEARFRTVIDKVPFDLILVDKDGRYVMQNTKSRERWGDIIGKYPQDFAPDGATLALWLDNNRRALSGEVVEGEVSFPVNGERRHFYNIVTPVWDGDEVGSILILNNDITERKLAEQALKESEEKYRSLVENVEIVVALFDRDGRFLFINRTGAEYLESTPAGVIGKSCHEVFPKQTADVILGRVRSVWDSRKGGQFEAELDISKGKRWFRSVYQPVTDSGGQPFGVQIIAHDITGLVQAERSIRDRDARLRLLISQVPAVLWTVDRDLRFTSSMGAGLQALGLGPGQVVGKDLYDYFGTDDPDFLPIAMHLKSLRGEAATYEFPWQGSTWETHTEPLRSETGEIIGCLAFALDVTERKLADEELKQSRENLRALAEKLHTIREAESANIAREIHDELGQTLTGLKFDLAFIKRRLTSGIAQVDRAALEDKINVMSKEIEATIKAVREISSELRPKDLDEFGLTGAIESLARRFEKRTGIKCEVNQYLPPNAEAQLDPKRSTAVFRIFQEILLNVRRHAHAKQVWIELRDEEDAFMLEVRDNGQGITPDKMKNLGHGLGILGMRERALVFGGNVSIESAPGKGTRVEVKIPMGVSR